MFFFLFTSRSRLLHSMKYLNYNINRLLIHITGMLVLIAFPNFFSSLHGRHFEVPDSRPGSGTRLSPLEHVRGFFKTLSD